MTKRDFLQSFARTPPHAIITMMQLISATSDSKSIKLNSSLHFQYLHVTWKIWPQNIFLAQTQPSVIPKPPFLIRSEYISCLRSYHLRSVLFLPLHNFAIHMFYDYHSCYAAKSGPAAENLAAAFSTIKTIMIGLLKHFLLY